MTNILLFNISYNYIIMFLRKNILDDHDFSGSSLPNKKSYFNFVFPSFHSQTYLKQRNTKPEHMNSSYYQWIFHIFRFMINLPLELYFFCRIHLYLYNLKSQKTDSNKPESVSTEPEETNTGERRAKLISWNLQFGNGIFEVNTLGKIINYLEDENPAICSFQEVLKCPKINQAEILQRKLGMKFQLFTPNFKYQDVELGSLILSNIPFEIYKTHDFYQIVTLKQELKVYLINIHLPSDVTCQYQKQIIKELILELEKIIEKQNSTSDLDSSVEDNYKIVMSGDFNLLPWCQEIEKINKLLKPVKNEEYTFPSNYPLVKYDYMFTNALDYEFKIGRVKYTDHLPLFLHLS